MPRKSKWFDNVTLYLCLPDELSLKINLLFRGTRLVIMKNQSHVVRLVSALIRTIGMGPIGWQALIFRDVSEVNNGLSAHALYCRLISDIKLKIFREIAIEIELQISDSWSSTK